MAKYLPAIAMWAAIAVGFVTMSNCFQSEQHRMIRERGYSACQKIHDDQARANCITGVGR